MELNKLITECQETLEEDIRQAIRAGIDHAGVTVNTNAGNVNIWCDRAKDITVIISHKENDRQSNRLEDHIARRLGNDIDWLSIENDVIEEIDSCDIWGINGFANAADFWNWKGC